MHTFVWSIAVWVQGRNCAYRSANVFDAVAPSGRHVKTLDSRVLPYSQPSTIWVRLGAVVSKNVWKLSNDCSIINVDSQYFERECVAWCHSL